MAESSSRLDSPPTPSQTQTAGTGGASEDCEDKFPYRLEVVYAPAVPPANPVQIVFVHGLNGSKRGTWTHSKMHFWPKWLHEEKGLEDVRILTFGYNSSTNILKPNTNLSIPIFANQLLLYLHQLSYKRGSVLNLSMG